MEECVAMECLGCYGTIKILFECHKILDPYFRKLFVLGFDDTQSIVC